MAKILDGNNISTAIECDVKSIVQQLSFVPQLSVVLVGLNEPSEIYVNMKIKACKRVGIDIEVYRLQQDSTENQIKELVVSLNENKNVHGILVQLPLPSHINQICVLKEISKDKDVDCFHPCNLGNIFYKDIVFTPCTAGAVLAMLNHYKISIFGKHVVVINDSILLGKPLASLLMNCGATVTVCNKQTEDIVALTTSAEVVVVGVGKRPDFVFDKRFCKYGAKIIDCGINKLIGIDGKSIVVGDVDFESIKDVASMVSIVPGGIGKITISILLQNVVAAARRFYELESSKNC